MFFTTFSLFLYEKEPETVKKKYLEPEPINKGPAPQHWDLYDCSGKIKTENWIQIRYKDGRKLVNYFFDEKNYASDRVD